VRSYRRLTTAVVVGALAAAALSSCRTAPNVAAYVGSTRFTEAKVDDLIAGAGAGVTRDLVVQTLVLDQTCKNLAAEKSFQPDTTNGEQRARQDQIAQDSAFAKVRSSMWSCIYGAPQPTGKPSEEDLRYAYQNLADAGLLPPGATFEQISPQLAQDQQISGSLAFRRIWLDAAAGQDISVSPRYRALTYSIFSYQGKTIVALTLGQPANAAVSDAPSAASTATSPARPQS
jgi:hypothetical protein